MIPLRLRQLLAVLILLTVVSLLLWLVIGPLLSRFQSDEEIIAGLQQRLTVYQRLVAELPAQEARLAELKRSDPMTRLVFAETRPALAGAELQQQIGQLVGQIGAQVISTQILSLEDAEAPLPAVGIKVHMRGETEQRPGQAAELEARMQQHEVRGPGQLGQVEGQRAAGADQVRGQLAEVGLVTNQGDATPFGDLRQLGHE